MEFGGSGYRSKPTTTQARVGFRAEGGALRGWREPRGQAWCRGPGWQASLAGEPTQGRPIQHLLPVLQPAWDPGGARLFLNSEAPVMLPVWHLFSVSQLLN